MSTKTKILVLKMKEIIYTVVFFVLAVILIILLVMIFRGKSHKKDSAANSTFTPGVYESSIILSQNPVEIQVVVYSEQIKSVSIVNTSDTIATMYPLISTSLNSLSEQIIKNNSTENIVFPDENKYTSIVLINAINEAISKARNN